MSIGFTIQLMAVSMVIIYRETIHRRTVDSNEWFDSYDYIVVGSGAAGSAVANRLSEDKNTSVLLLEAGDRQSILNDIPGSGISGQSYLGLQYDWNYTLTKQSIGLGYANQTIKLRHGKVLGGSSSVNGMVYNRGNRRDFDDWAQTFGVRGWGYKRVMPYFIKSEKNYDLNLVKKSRNYHGTAGPIGIESYKDPDPIFIIMEKLFNQFGYPTVDINGPQQYGTAISQSFISAYGLRSTAANAYIDPNPNPNLHILVNSLVTRVLFNGLTAVGVEFFKDNKLFGVKANREVILCAGSPNSPQILMLSGIGPEDHLKELEIPIIADLPVGNYYQDQPSLKLKAILKNDKLSEEIPEMNVEQMFQLFTKYSGPLSRRVSSILYESSKNNEDKEWPNLMIQTTLAFEYIKNVSQSVAQYCCYRKQWTEYYKELINQKFIEIQMSLVKPRSFGTIRLKSNVPLDAPLIDPKFLSHPKDLEDFMEIIKLSLFLIQNTTLSKYVYLPKTGIPPCRFCQEPNARPQYQCDRYIRCMIRQIATSYFHSVGGCRMGLIDRTDVVVDPRLRVKNVSGLRVCDASVMPRIVNANTGAAALMIGERCAHMIKEDHIRKISRLNRKLENEQNEVPHSNISQTEKESQNEKSQNDQNENVKTS